MKIKQEYWEMVKSGTKTVEIRTVDSFYDNLDFCGDRTLIGDLFASIELDTDPEHQIGTIYFNKYEVVTKSEFFTKVNYGFGFWNKGIYNDWINSEKSHEFLEEYLKDEEQVVILYIDEVVDYE